MKRKERREILSKGPWQWWKVPVDSGLGSRAAECLDVRAFPNIRRDYLLPSDLVFRDGRNHCQ